MAQCFTMSLCWRRESHPQRAGYTADAGGSVAGSVHLRFLKNSREKSPINCPMVRNPAMGLVPADAEHMAQRRGETQLISPAHGRMAVTAGSKIGPDRCVPTSMLERSSARMPAVMKSMNARVRLGICCRLR